jgi:heptosyltransferase-2
LKILIVAPAWVGDMVMAHVLVQALQARAAERGDAPTEVHLLAPPATAPLGARMPGVAQTHRFELAHGELGLGKRRAAARALRALNFDQAIVLPNSFKSALVPFWARIPRRTGWHGELRLGLLNDRRPLAKDRYPLMIERFLALAEAPGAALATPYPQPQLAADADNAEARLVALALTTARPVLALCPGAEFGPAKQWPAAHYAAVASAALQAGQDVWLFGSPKDAASGDEILASVAARDGLPGADRYEGPGPGRLRREATATDPEPQQLVNLAGHTNLVDAIDLLAVTEAAVCNDSGLMHIAAALGLPLIAVYGSTSPDFTPPLSPSAQVLRHPLPCSPCFERTCPLQHMNCLNDLAPERVIRALGLGAA